MNNVEVGHCSLFSCAKGHLYGTLRMQELPMMISSDNLMITTLKVMILKTATVKRMKITTTSRTTVHGSSGEKQVERSLIIIVFLCFFFFF